MVKNSPNFKEMDFDELPTTVSDLLKPNLPGAGTGYRARVVPSFSIEFRDSQGAQYGIGFN